MGTGDKSKGAIYLNEFINFERINVEIPEKPANKIETVSIEKLDMKINVERNGFLPRNGGEWTGEPGNSIWKPDRDLEPGDRNGTNPENKTWDEILVKYGIDGIPFKDGEPDFSEISKGTVQIDDFSDDRSSNFDQADEKMAEQRGCTPEEVAKWRKENGYTWHELKDCQTMMKVPTEVHGNIPHSGGVSEYKSQHASTVGI